VRGDDRGNQRMPIVVRPFADGDIEALQQFNERLRTAGAAWQFPESPIPTHLAPLDSLLPYNEILLAVDGGSVRGGYVLKRQAFSLDGVVTTIGHNTHQLSEGIVDFRFGHVGLLVLKDALKRHPMLFGLGIGGYDEAIARLLKAASWSMISCPFFFKVVHPYRFLREIVFLRSDRTRRVTLDALAYSGLGWVGIRTVHFLRSLPAALQDDATGVEVDVFSAWTDEVWDRAKGAYRMIAVRDAHTLNRIYPATDKRCQRLQIQRGSQVIGWAVVMTTKREAHSHFGAMRIGSVVDCLATPGEERHVVAAATRYLERARADIIVTNQLHHAWCDAFPRTGYLRGPSNFLFTVSPKLADRLHPFEATASRIHMTRGDGDGPLNL
jgi:hypothetical protein